MLQMNEGVNQEPSKRPLKIKSVDSESQVSQDSSRNNSFSGSSNKRQFYLRVHMTGGNQPPCSPSEVQKAKSSVGRQVNCIRAQRNLVDAEKISNASEQLLNKYTPSNKLKSKIIQNIAQHKSFPPLFVGCVKSHYGPRWASISKLKAAQLQSPTMRQKQIIDKEGNIPARGKPPKGKGRKDSESEAADDEAEEGQEELSDREKTSKKNKKQSGVWFEQLQSTPGILKNRSKASLKLKTVSFDNYQHPDLATPAVEYEFLRFLDEFLKIRRLQRKEVILNRYLKWVVILYLNGYHNFTKFL